MLADANFDDSIVFDSDRSVLSNVIISYGQDSNSLAPQHYKEARC